MKIFPEAAAVSRENNGSGQEGVVDDSGDTVAHSAQPFQSTPKAK
ncbi:hypothetical protein [Chitinibacter bivalviorum]|nr:hypothetical protein [Chitinibacter bivalviorum]